MKAVVNQSEPDFTPLRIPASKSLGHRAIICASLAQGKTLLTNVDYSVDIHATCDAMSQLGARIEKREHEILIEGCDLSSVTIDSIIDAHESGSTLRFLIPLFSLTNQKVTFTGSGKLMQRPLTIYEELFKKQGLFYQQDHQYLTIEGSLSAGEYEIAGNISSQFITGLLMTLPLLSHDSTIKVSHPFESKSYVVLTIEMMNRFGVEVKWVDENTLFVKGNQKYQAQDEVAIDSDYSQAAFFAVLGQINQPVCLKGLNEYSSQGDKAIIDMIQKLGGNISFEKGYLISRPAHLTGTELDLADCPDLGPILMVLASQCEGTTTMIHAGRLRIKESDRIAAMEEELRKFGVQISSTEDTITVVGNRKLVQPGIVQSHNDHRIVMSCAVLASCCGGCTIEQADAINKSYPCFFEDCLKLGLEVNYHD